MGEERNRLAQVLESLRGLSLGPWNDRLGPEILRQTAEALEAARTQGDGADPGLLAGLALALRRLAAKAPPGAAPGSVGAACLAGLAGLSSFGQVLAAGFLRAGAVSPDQAFDALADLSPADRLGLANRLLLNPVELSPEWRLFALDRLAEVAAEGVPDLARFLRRAETPAFAVVQAALDGALGHQLHQALARSRSQTETREAAALLARHAPWELEEILPGRLVQAEPKHGRALLEGLACLSRTSEALAAEVLPLLKAQLKEGDLPGAKASLAALLAARPANLGVILATTAKARPELAPFLAARLPGIGAGDFALLRKSLGQGGAGVVLALFLLLARAASRPLFACLKWCLAEAARKDPGTRPGNEEVKALQALFAVRRSMPAAPPAPVPARDLPVHAPPGGTPGQPDKAAKGKASAFATIDSGPARPPDEERKGAEPRLSATGQLVPDLCLEDRDLARPNLAGAFLHRGRATRCRFAGGLMAGAVFLDLSLRQVEFIGCDLRQTRWHGLDLDRVRFTDCDLSGAVFTQITARRLVIELSSLAGARLAGLTVGSGLLDSVEAAGLLASDCRFAGVEFRHVLFPKARFESCTFESVTLSACALAEAQGRSLAATHPELAALAGRTRAEDLAALEGSALPAPPPVLIHRAALADCALRRWYEAESFCSGLNAFLTANLRRESWCAQRLGPDKAPFYGLLPLLLHHPAFDAALGLSPDTPACRVAAYEADESVLALAERLFPGLELAAGEGPEAPARPGVEIQAVYTIGSLGSVAQDPASDLDYWVCASLSGLPPEKRGLLQRKLEAIEAWAGQRFGLEVHFFLMDVEDVRRNNFGFSDEESSGSAQALMLKEEFYRTAMLAAGRPPLWWMVPGGASERAYELTRARVRALLGEGACVDLGHAGRIPEAEFFGASLWQIVKGLKSPFKSVMKFALLERYIRGGGDAPLLCDRIKANLAAGRTRLWEADPYVLLYHEVIAHYRRMNDAPAMELITLAFLLKSGLTAAGEDAPTPCRAEERDLPDLLAQVAAQTPGGREGLPSSAGATYEGVLALGVRVNQFLVATYNSVRDSMPAGAKALITPEDLTKLGRKIFTTFAKRPNKVEHISFLEAMQARLGEILFTAAPSKAGRVWKLEAGVLDQSSGRVLYTPLKQGRGLAALLAWAAMNGLSRGGAPVRADLSVSPLTAQDLGEAMAALAAFFAPVLSHEGSIGESLKAERVTRAFFLLNLTAPRESAARVEGQVVYATNWGEIFCVDVPVARPEFAAVPASFLREVLKLEAPEDVALGVFVPARAQCQAPEWAAPRAG